MQVSILRPIKVSRYLSLMLMVSTLSSCAWMTERTSLFGEDEAKAKEAPLQMVPKEQYDQLLSKYETLVDQVKSAEVQKRDSVEKPFQGGDPSEIVNQLSKVQPPADLAETVDVFNEQKKMVDQNESMLGQSGAGIGVSDNAIENQIVRLRKGIVLVNQNRFDQALSVFKDLEQSPVPQIQVRAKFYLGEMLFMQNEYDLAMQVFEEIISKHSFSGVVIKALGRLIVCSEKLKLDKKREKYYSILHDFFGAA